MEPVGSESLDSDPDSELTAFDEAPITNSSWPPRKPSEAVAPLAAEVASFVPAPVPAPAPVAAPLPPGPSLAAEPDDRAVVLVVDGDAVARHFVVKALAAHAPSLRVEAVTDGAAALDVLREQRVDVVLCESDLGDMAGRRLQGFIRQQQRLREIPFLVFSSDGRPSLKASALRAGADDYLVKPSDPEELAMRIEAAALRTRRLRAQSEDAPPLAGRLEAISVIDLVRWLERDLRSGTLCLAADGALGEIALVEGRVVHASFGKWVGEEAFFAAARATRGSFELTDDRWKLAATINGSTGSLLAAAEGQSDGAGAELQPRALSFDRNTRMRRATETVSAGLVSSPARDSAVAGKIMRGIDSPYVVGDLHLCDARDLHRWSRREEARVRLHVLLVADPANLGVAGMLSLAGEATESLALSSLRGDPKALGLQFVLRDEHLLDVILIDDRNPRLFRDVLVRQPALVIVAPGSGQTEQGGPKFQVGLDKLLLSVRPQVVVVLGEGVPSELLPRFTVVEQGLSELARLPLPPSQVRSDLRQVLLRSLALWGRRKVA